jgi:hypothetical protein
MSSPGSDFFDRECLWLENSLAEEVFKLFRDQTLSDIHSTEGRK